MLAGERPTIFGDGKQSRDFTYVANVVDGNLLAAKVPDAVGKTFNIACGEQLEPARPGRGDQSRARHQDRTDLRSAACGRRPRQPGRHLASETVLGYKPLVDFDEGLRRSIEFYRTLVKK